MGGRDLCLSTLRVSFPVEFDLPFHRGTCRWWIVLDVSLCSCLPVLRVDFGTAYLAVLEATARFMARLFSYAALQLHIWPERIVLPPPLARRVGFFSFLWRCGLS